jgi:FeS assembly SUF system protein
MEQGPEKEGTISAVEQKLIEGQVVEAIRTCYDPEIPVNIYDMGLIYGISVDDQGNVVIAMTLTTPYCPAAQSLPGEVERKVKGVPGVKNAKVEIVWSPAWNPGMMTEAAKLELGMQ